MTIWRLWATAQREPEAPPLATLLSKAASAALLSPRGRPLFRARCFLIAVCHRGPRPRLRRDQPHQRVRERERFIWLERGVLVRPSSLSSGQALVAMRKAAALFAFLFWPVHSRALLGAQGLRGSAVPSSVARDNGGDFGADRETQSPVVWLRLHKTELEHTAPSWHDISFAEQAAERQGELTAKRESS